MKAPCVMHCEVNMVMIDSKWRIAVIRRRRELEEFLISNSNCRGHYPALCDLGIYVVLLIIHYASYTRLLYNANSIQCSKGITELAYNVNFVFRTTQPFTQGLPHHLLWRPSLSSQVQQLLSPSCPSFSDPL